MLLSEDIHPKSSQDARAPSLIDGYSFTSIFDAANPTESACRYSVSFCPIAPVHLGEVSDSFSAFQQLRQNAIISSGDAKSSPFPFYVPTCSYSSATQTKFRELNAVPAPFHYLEYMVSGSKLQSIDHAFEAILSVGEGSESLFLQNLPDFLPGPVNPNYAANDSFLQATLATVFSGLNSITFPAMFKQSLFSAFLVPQELGLDPQELESELRQQLAGCQKPEQLLEQAKDKIKDILLSKGVPQEGVDDLLAHFERQISQIELVIYRPETGGLTPTIADVVARRPANLAMGQDEGAHLKSIFPFIHGFNVRLVLDFNPLAPDDEAGLAERTARLQHDLSALEQDLVRIDPNHPVLADIRAPLEDPLLLQTPDVLETLKFRLRDISHDDYTPVGDVMRRSWAFMPAVLVKMPWEDMSTRFSCGNAPATVSLATDHKTLSISWSMRLSSTSTADPDLHASLWALQQLAFLRTPGLLICNQPATIQCTPLPNPALHCVDISVSATIQLTKPSELDDVRITSGDNFLHPSGQTIEILHTRTPPVPPSETAQTQPPASTEKPADKEAQTRPPAEENKATVKPPTLAPSVMATAHALELAAQLGLPVPPEAKQLSGQGLGLFFGGYSFPITNTILPPSGNKISMGQESQFRSARGFAEDLIQRMKGTVQIAYQINDNPAERTSISLFLTPWPSARQDFSALSLSFGRAVGTLLDFQTRRAIAGLEPFDVHLVASADVGSIFQRGDVSFGQWQGNVFTRNTRPQIPLLRVELGADMSYQISVLRLSLHSTLRGLYDPDLASSNPISISYAQAYLNTVMRFSLDPNNFLVPGVSSYLQTTLQNMSPKDLQFGFTFSGPLSSSISLNGGWMGIDKLAPFGRFNIQIPLTIFNASGRGISGYVSNDAVFGPSSRSIYAGYRLDYPLPLSGRGLENLAASAEQKDYEIVLQILQNYTTVLDVYRQSIEARVRPTNMSVIGLNSAAASELAGKLQTQKYQSYASDLKAKYDVLCQEKDQELSRTVDFPSIAPPEKRFHLLEDQIKQLAQESSRANPVLVTPLIDVRTKIGSNTLAYVDNQFYPALLMAKNAADLFGPNQDFAQKGGNYLGGLVAAIHSRLQTFSDQTKNLSGANLEGYVPPHQRLLIIGNGGSAKIGDDELNSLASLANSLNLRIDFIFVGKPDAEAKSSLQSLAAATGGVVLDKTGLQESDFLNPDDKAMDALMSDYLKAVRRDPLLGTKMTLANLWNFSPNTKVDQVMDERAESLQDSGYIWGVMDCSHFVQSVLAPLASMNALALSDYRGEYLESGSLYDYLSSKSLPTNTIYGSNRISGLHSFDEVQVGKALIYITPERRRKTIVVSSITRISPYELTITATEAGAGTPASEGGKKSKKGRKETRQKSPATYYIEHALDKAGEPYLVLNTARGKMQVLGEYLFAGDGGRFNYIHNGPNSQIFVTAIKGKPGHVGIFTRRTALFKAFSLDDLALVDKLAGYIPVMFNIPPDVRALPPAWSSDRSVFRIEFEGWNETDAQFGRYCKAVLEINFTTGHAELRKYQFAGKKFSDTPSDFVVIPLNVGGTPQNCLLKFQELAYIDMTSRKDAGMHLLGSGQLRKGSRRMSGQFMNTIDGRAEDLYNGKDLGSITEQFKEGTLTAPYSLAYSRAVDALNRYHVFGALNTREVDIESILDYATPLATAWDVLDGLEHPSSKPKK